MYRVHESLEEYRWISGTYKSDPRFPCGLFSIPFRNNNLSVMAYDGKHDGWEHVSVSLKNRCPNWEEMCFVKSLFWEDEDCVMQLHPPKSEWINNHPYCLHLWRPKEHVIPRPPNIAVGVKISEECDGKD